MQHKVEEGDLFLDTTSQTEQLHYCKICHLPYARKATLRQHELTHIKPEPELKDEKIDSMIGKVINGDVNKMKPRVLIEKLKPEETEPQFSKLFPCDYCEKAFTQKQSLIQHMRLKHKHKLKFSCSICKQRFDNTKSLHAHLRRCVPCMLLFH